MEEIREKLEQNQFNVNTLERLKLILGKLKYFSSEQDNNLIR